MRFTFNKMFKRIQFFLILFLCFLNLLITNNCAFGENKDEEKSPIIKESITIIKNEKSQAERYKICAGDLLSIAVYDEPDLTQSDIIVRPDGYATINPVGEVFVEGLSIEELTKVLEGKFVSYVNYPKVSVAIKDFNPASVYIFGAVQKPGTYQQMTALSKQFADSKNPTVRTDLTLVNVISNAGGISTNADLSNISITSDDKTEKKVNLWKFIREGDISQNVKLRSGDSIFVPKLESALQSDEDFRLITKMSLFPVSFPVRVIGEVRVPGTYDIKGESPYLNTAVSDAEGYTLEAKKTAVIVYRKASNEKLARIYVDPFKQDFLLRPNDLIEVKKRSLMKCVAGASYLTKLISPFMSIGTTANSWADLVAPRRRFFRF